MLKKLIQISSLTSLLAIGAILPAAAGSEEDAAAPAGSFTSDMAAPARANHFTCHDHAFRFHHHARLERRMEP